MLDVGAGNGRQAIGLVELGVASYTGLEVVKRSVEYANAVFASQGSVRLDWLDVRNPMYNPHGSQPPEKVTFPYSDATFNFTVALSLYTHLERLDAAHRVTCRRPPTGYAPPAARFVDVLQEPTERDDGEGGANGVRRGGHPQDRGGVVRDRGRRWLQDDRLPRPVASVPAQALIRRTPASPWPARGTTRSTLEVNPRSAVSGRQPGARRHALHATDSPKQVQQRAATRAGVDWQEVTFVPCIRGS